MTRHDLTDTIGLNTIKKSNFCHVIFYFLFAHWPGKFLNDADVMPMMPHALA